jgi:DNA replication and repair protein RecF
MPFMPESAPVRRVFDPCTSAPEGFENVLPLMSQYRRVLEQRNRLLKLMRETGRDGDTLAVWDEQLVAEGARLMERRIAFVADLNRYAREIHAELAGASEELTLTYVPSFPVESAEGIAEAFQARLGPLFRDEVARGATLLGPHRDEMLFLVNGADVRVYGSQGQQRSVVLAARLAEVELMAERVGEPPVLLLDDAASELDEARRQHLFSLVRNGYQAFITCTETAQLPPALLEGAAQYRVSAGAVEREALLESVC